MRVLVVGDFLKSSGMTNYIFNVIGNISSSDLKFEALAVSGSEECKERVENLGWKFHVIAPANGSLIKHNLQAFSFFKKNASKYDVIHFNETALWNFLPIVFANYFCSGKIVINSHNTYFASDGKWIVFKVLEVLHAIGKKVVSKTRPINIAVSEEAATWMFEKKTIRLNNYKVISNGIDLKEFTFNQKSRSVYRKKLKVKDDEILFGNVGILNQRKNQLRLLDIFKDILSKTPSARLVLIGDGPLLNKIQDKIIELDLSEKVIMTGKISNVRDYYQAMDALVMPSYNEGLSTVLLEAQTIGLKIFPSKEMPLGNYLDSLVFPISLKKSNKEWATVINDKMGSYRRTSHLEAMKKRNYDLSSASECISEIYLGGIN
ncbi:glycosyltransferase [Lactiplantibacillus daowaiensis]|uniref:Glycosyltransferase n=1 Tax=Lactiplantibacillus daowaiensis TaxID=2559918 RepID=A0ABW1RWH8_9LACO|nr:glycosyltransferase [Lactiplantibacillus daowaiensis]